MGGVAFSRYAHTPVRNAAITLPADNRRRRLNCLRLSLAARTQTQRCKADWKIHNLWPNSLYSPLNSVFTMFLFVCVRLERRKYELVRLQTGTGSTGRVIIALSVSTDKHSDLRNSSGLYMNKKPVKVFSFKAPE